MAVVVTPMTARVVEKSTALVGLGYTRALVAAVAEVVAEEE